MLSLSERQLFTIAERLRNGRVGLLVLDIERDHRPGKLSGRSSINEAIETVHAALPGLISDFEAIFDFRAVADDFFLFIALKPGLSDPELYIRKIGNANQASVGALDVSALRRE